MGEYLGHYISVFCWIEQHWLIFVLPVQVIAYGVSINLVEVTWKGKIKAQFPNPNDYSAFMGDFSSCTGAATLVMMLLSRFIFTRFGWGVAAIITPTVLGLTGKPCCCCSG